MALREGDYATSHRYALAALACYENENSVCIWYGKEKGQSFHQADILGTVGHTHWCLGDYAAAGEYLQRAIALADEGHRPQHWGQLARQLVTVGDYSRAEPWALKGPAAARR